MTDENSPPPAPAPLCEWVRCGKPVPESRGATPRKYCSQSCRQRAYEQRRTQSIVAVAVGVERQRNAKNTPV